MDGNEIKNRLQKYYNNWETNKQIVTCFLLTHQRPYYLSLMIDSILKQTYSNFYLIVLDNISGDNTREVVESFNDVRIIYLERESNKNIEITNFEFAFLTCKTKYLTIFHDDDILENCYLEEMIKVMQKNKDITCLSCQCQFIDGDNKIIGEKRQSSKELITFSGGTSYLQDGFIRQQYDMWMYFPAVMYKTLFYKENIMNFSLNAGPASDILVYSETERFGGTIGIYGMCLYNYRMHNNQVSSVSLNPYIINFLLESFFFSDDYYHECAMNNLDFFSNNLSKVLAKAINDYKNKKLSKKMIKTIYGYIPKELAKCKSGKKRILYFAFFKTFPDLSIIILRLKRIIGK